MRKRGLSKNAISFVPARDDYPGLIQVCVFTAESTGVRQSIETPLPPVEPRRGLAK